MFNVSREFAPPFKLIAPYFIIGGIIYVAAILFLLFMPGEFSHADALVIGWLHLFLLGFVMMIIFGAMAQLVPVVLEVGHFSVDFYYLIWPVLAVGTLMMAYGFAYYPSLVPVGGVAVIISMLIFLADLFFTLKKVENFSLTVKAVIVSNIFLTVGILAGFAMSLNFIGLKGADITDYLGSHAFLVAGGYVTLTIMGLSMVLLPMFSLAHGFDEKPVTAAFYMMTLGISLILLGTFIGESVFRAYGILAVLISVVLYLYQVYILYKMRVRKENDIWAKSMFVGYGSLAISWIFGVLYLMIGSENLLLTSGWFLFMGFFTFLIIGHLYKIIPFLVWFERYSPLVGKEKVPMLHEMFPKKEADMEFRFASVGMAVSGLALFLGSFVLFKAGILLLLVSTGYFLYSLKFMLFYGKK